MHQSNLPAAVAGRLEQILRTCLWLVFALQETKITVSRLRRVLFGKAFEASAPVPQEALAPCDLLTQKQAEARGADVHGNDFEQQMIPLLPPPPGKATTGDPSVLISWWHG